MLDHSYYEKPLQEVVILLTRQCSRKVHAMVTMTNTNPLNGMITWYQHASNN
jgi:hypothetical protein